jgi:hypothetical protein
MLKIQTNIATISDLVMKNHFEMIQFKPSEIALVIIIMSRLLSHVKDNSKFNRQFIQSHNMDQEAILDCKQAMDLLLLEAGLTTESTQHTNISLNCLSD